MTNNYYSFSIIDLINSFDGQYFPVVERFKIKKSSIIKLETNTSGNNIEQFNFQINFLNIIEID